MKPLIKWAGGKAWLKDTLRHAMPPEFDAYCEPFAGGAALFFSGAAKGHFAALNDANAELISFYRTVRDLPRAVFDACAEYKVDAEHYYAVRARNEGNAVERASRFLYLNKTCFNGLYRVNAKGEFNTPWGKKKPDLEWYNQYEFEAAQCALQNVKLTSQHYREVTSKLRKGDFVYLDPPYDVEPGAGNFTSYTKGGFGPQQQRELIEEYWRLTECGVYVLMSNAATPWMLEIYNNRYTARLLEFSAPRAIGAKTRAPAREILVANYPCDLVAPRAPKEAA